ncbi:MAG: hypothetical protein K6T83_19520 [Alicyclobacillus sp.]|nr:hypothetical protein [Alicyclobacillus sp.]
MEKPSVLFHGSPVRVASLEPRPARGVGAAHDQLTAVYASHIKNFAIAFAISPPAGSGTFAWELEIDENQVPKITYTTGRPNLGGVGYVYHLPSATFEQIDDEQWVSFVAVVPIKCEIVKVDDYLHWTRFSPDSLG